MKNNYIAILVFTLLTISFTACDKENRCIRGSGSTVNKTIDLTAFSGVDLRLAGDVEVIKSNTSKIEIQAKENLIDLIRTDIISGTLRIDMDNRCVKGNTDLHFKVYTPELGHLRVAGSGSIYSAEEFPQRNWTLIIDGSGDITARINGLHTQSNISGSGKMVLQGTTNQLETRISGSGNIHAFGLTAKALAATISGSGNTEATVTETLSATISGSGNVRYKGQPSITNLNLSGSGRVERAN